MTILDHVRQLTRLRDGGRILGWQSVGSRSLLLETYGMTYQGSVQLLVWVQVRRGMYGTWAVLTPGHPQFVVSAGKVSVPDNVKDSMSPNAAFDLLREMTQETALAALQGLDVADATTYDTTLFDEALVNRLWSVGVLGTEKHLAHEYPRVVKDMTLTKIMTALEEATAEQITAISRILGIE